VKNYFQNPLSLFEPKGEIRRHKHSQSSITSRNNNIFSSSKNSTSGRESIKEEKGLSRKSSFSYVPSSERTSTNGFSPTDVEMNLLHSG